MDKSLVGRAHAIISLAILTAAALVSAARAADAPRDAPQRKTITLCGHVLDLMTADEVKALGFPWTDVADEDNAATYYIQGANALHELKTDAEAEKQRQHVETNVWDDSLKELAAALDAAKPALDFYRQGAAKELCQLPMQKTEMLAAMLLSDLPKARQAARLLVADARRLESQKKFKEAVDNYVAVLRIGEHYGAGRTLIDQLVGMVCFRYVTQGAFTGIYRNPYPKEELRRLVSELGKLRGGLPQYAHGLRIERAAGLHMVDQMAHLGPGEIMAVAGAGINPDLAPTSPLGTRLFRVLVPDRTMKKDMAAFYDRAIAAAAKPYQAADSDEALMKGCKPWNFFAQLLLPALGRVRGDVERCRASLDLLQVGVALRLYNMDTGVYPDELAWLVKDKYLPEVPNDPFSGKPLFYKPADGEFTLYSVSDNMKDDGGKTALPEGGGYAPDWGIASRLEPPKKYKATPGK